MQIKVFIVYVIVFLPLFIFGQEAKDTVNQLREVVITATRTSNTMENIPGRIALISSQEVEENVVNNTDDILRSIANIYVNRSWGIFSRNSSVTMRGMDASARVLVLLDYIPLNKTAGGAINWHMINPETIDRIEIVKGPSSALYGNNAMGGVINIITKTPEEKLSINANLYGGAYNTYGCNFFIGSSEINDNKGFYWGINADYRYSEGYIFEPDSLYDTTDTETCLREKTAGIKLGYQFNPYHKIVVAYLYYDDIRGSGRKIYDGDGAYLSYPTNTTRLKYTGALGKYTVEANTYFMDEEYYEKKEGINDYYEYKLSEVFLTSKDIGLWLGLTRTIGKNKITSGIDLKSGIMDGEDVYRTSFDHIYYDGNRENAAAFIQDELKLNDRINIIAGLRYDYAKFYNGRLDVVNPSKNTGFTEGFISFYADHSWAALSPKFAVNYNFNESISTYFSFGSGFNGPKLKDLVSSGKIRKGFKLSNPELTPEKLNNYEIGITYIFNNKIKAESSVYYSYGKDFQYLVATGDTVDTGGSSLKPEYRKENVSEVEILGTELSFHYYINKHINFYGSYSYNHSKIKAFSSNIDTTKDLSGKYLMEVSPNLAYIGLKYKSEIFNVSLTYQFIDKQFADDENITIVDAYSLIDLKLWKQIKSHYTVFLDIDNILDTEYIDRKGQLSPGRFIIAGIKYKL